MHIIFLVSIWGRLELFLLFKDVFIFLQSFLTHKPMDFSKTHWDIAYFGINDISDKMFGDIVDKQVTFYNHKNFEEFFELANSRHGGLGWSSLKKNLVALSLFVVKICAVYVETNMRDWLDAVEIMAEEVETEGDSLR